MKVKALFILLFVSTALSAQNYISAIDSWASINALQDSIVQIQTNGQPAAPKTAFQAFRTAGGAISGKVDFDSQVIINNGISYSAGDHTILAPYDGKKINITVQIEGNSSGNNRVQVCATLFKNGVAQANSEACNYTTRNTSQNKGGVVIANYIVTATLGDVWHVETARTGSTLNYAPGTRITIIEL